MQTSLQILQGLFFLLTLVLLGLIIFGLKKALPKDSDRFFQIMVVGIVVWLFIVSYLSLTGKTSDFSKFPPPLILVLFPPFLFALFLTFSGKADALLSTVPPYWLLYIQSFRVLVEVFLFKLYIIHALPVQMTFEGRNWDILVGLTAPLAGYILYKKRDLFNIILPVWNIFGLILLFNIVSISLLSAPSPFRIFMNSPANTLLGYFPFVLLPSVLVPVAYTMHFLSLRQWLLLKKQKFYELSQTL